MLQQGIISLSDDSDNNQAMVQALMAQFENSKSRRSNWESLWQDCYDYALPQRAGFMGTPVSGNRRHERLFDATALDAVDQLASSLLGHLTPPWTPWFGLKAGPELSDEEKHVIAPVLEKSARIMQGHFDRSNFVVEIHQCFLDLVVGGTASIALEETEPGAYSAFRFTSVPLHDVVLEEGIHGVLDTTFRVMELTLGQIKLRFPYAELPLEIVREGEKETQSKFKILESVQQQENTYSYTCILIHTTIQPVLLANGHFASSPFINFRWMKSPGEVYGRSPVMKSLPDIKTANKVVELILKNASIAVTGIWQADDDGILNPANIELVPGAIIPKAVGSKGLTPLEMPARFDVSQLVLDDLRQRIRHALLVDRLPQMDSRRMTATEVVERSSEMALLLGATYGRLQSEFITPLIQRAYAILRRRGEVPDIPIDGRRVEIDFRSPLARAQAQRHVNSILTWVQNVSAMGPEALIAADMAKIAMYLGQTTGVPQDLMRDPALAIQETVQTLQSTLPNQEGDQ